MPHSTPPVSSSPSMQAEKTQRKRKPVSKGARFDVFKRDLFTCQYCGARPPQVVLVVDHITPVAAGGANDTSNLITACVDCNAGKRDKLLTDRVVRPDADLMFLETQQEIAELQRYQAALVEREAALSKYIDSVQDLWVAEAGTDWAPSEELLRKILRKYDAEILEAAVTDVASKVSGGYVKTNGGGWIRYLWGVAKHMDEGF